MIRLTSILALCLIAPVAQAATYPAASASYEDVEDAIALASDSGDDIVTIPASANGVAVWTTRLTIDKAITLQGAGVGVTYITDSVPSTSGSGRLINWSTTAGKAYRMTGIEINFSKSPTYFGCIGFSGGSTAMVVDNLKFTGPSNGFAFWVSGSVCGVANDLEFVNTGIAFQHQQGTLFSDPNGYGDHSWEQPTNWGSANAWYIEDCVGTNVNAFTDGWRGCRFVVRNCTLSDSSIQNHGTESGQRYRGGRTIESYRNTLTLTAPITDAHHIRSGSAMIWGNTMSSSYTNAVKLRNYRTNQRFKPWFDSDGTVGYDQPDLTDDGSTPGGAGDGVFESNTTFTSTVVGSSGVQGTATDSTKSWTEDQWLSYNARITESFTASSGTTSSPIRVTVSPDPGWATDEWIGYTITKGSTTSGLKGTIASNTNDTLTLSTNYARPTFTTGDAFQLSYAWIISGNTATTLEFGPSIGSTVSYAAFQTGKNYEIRRVAGALDQPGYGVSGVITGETGLNVGTPPNQTLSQEIEPIYTWLNVTKTNVSSSTHYINANVDYFAQNGSFDGTSGTGSGTAAAMAAITPTTTGVGFWVTDEGEWDSTNGGTADGRLYVWDGDSWELHYTPYTYPHPLRADVAPDEDPPSLQTVTINAGALNLNFTENIVGGAAAQFTIAGRSLSTYTGTGPTRSLTVTPPAENGDVLTLVYTPGDIEDAFGNPLASFSVPIENNTPEDPSSPSRRNSGRRPRGGSVLIK